MLLSKYTKSELENMSHTHLVHVILEIQKEVFEDWNKWEVKKDSTNSSIPPSQDRFWKWTNTTREKSWKKSWGQKWHIWITREYEKPDKVIVIKPIYCNKTGELLTEENSKFRLVCKKRTIDIDIKKEVVEYEVWEAEYNWNITKWELPSYIIGHTQIWPKLEWLIAYLNVYQKIPQDRLCQLFDDVWDIKISEWTVNNALNRIWTKAKSFYVDIMKHIKKSNCAWSDETWNKINWKWAWIWIRQNNQWNYYNPSMTRWYSTVKESFWEDYTGVLVHDCYSAQNNTIAGMHQLCLEHIKRDLKYSIAEKTGYQKIAWNMLKLIKKSWKAQAKLIDGTIPIEYQTKIKVYYETQLKELCLMCEESSWMIKKLAKRMIKHMDKMFVFLWNLLVPRHNNASEKWLRMQKLHQKISWWFRSFNGAKIHCMILSLIESMKKQWRNVMAMFYDLACNQFILDIPE